MVFFYDQMTGGRAADPGHDWGFRHAWTLNLSLPTGAWRTVGGFCERLPRAVYEDLEFAWRLRERFGAPVLFRPGAIVLHDHRYEPMALLARDVVLGYESVNLARFSPACAREMFRREVGAPSEAAFQRQFVEREERAARRNIGLFTRTAGLPASAVDGAAATELVALLYEQSILVRRWLFGVGLLAAAEGRSLESAQQWAGVAPGGSAPVHSAAQATVPVPA